MFKLRWEEFRGRLVEEMERLMVGNLWEYESFVGLVIYEGSFKKLVRMIDEVNGDEELELFMGGMYDGLKGWFVKFIIYLVKKLDYKLFFMELFGFVLMVYVYDDMIDLVGVFGKVCEVVDGVMDYGLMGLVFVVDRVVVRFVEEKLRNVVGNFYINCKSMGVVVG